MTTQEAQFADALIKDCLRLPGNGPMMRYRSGADAIARQCNLELGVMREILERWTDLGWWQYGVSSRAGWLTLAGIATLGEHGKENPDAR